MNIGQELHEKLCAYVLGESEGADRAEVERELLRSPELRAERERLESTIGAVRDAMKPAQTLSAEAREALDRAVRPSKVVQFPWMRMAAGIGAVGLGWWIFAQPDGRQPAEPIVREIPAGSEEEAEIERAVALLAPNATEAQRAQLRDAVRRYEGDAQAKFDQLNKAGGALESLGYAGDAKSVDERWREVSKRTPLEFGGSVPVEPSASTASVHVADADVPLVLERKAIPKNEEAEIVSMDTAAVELKSAAGEPAGSEGVAPTKPGDVGVGQSTAVGAPGTSPFEGRKLGIPPAKGRSGGTTVSKSSELAQGASLPPSRSYRGPGDAVPPSGGGGGSSMPGLTSVGRTSAPSSPGPSGPATGGPAGPGGGNGFVGEKSKKAAELKDFGYAGDDEDVLLRRARERSWRELSPDEQTHAIELRYRTITEGCFPRPNERPRDMFFRFWGDNPFEVALLDKQSTFSVDVDTASYALARRYLAEGNVPEKAQVRTEEFVNYFASDVEAPRSATFSVHSDLTPSRFSSDAARRMLRVVVRGKDVDKAERQPLHLTFVVDVSGSMKEQNRLETVKHALRMLVAQLDGRDSIAIVSFSNDAKLVLPMTRVVDRTAIEAAIAPLAPNGSTNSNAGLQLGYAQALDGFDANAVNRVVFLADGVANVGETDASKILEGVRPMREKGIYLNTIGVGMNNHNDVLLEQLANKGDGVCNYVDSAVEIQRALVDRFTGAFQPIAKDVKIQVEFDPQQVMRYRLLGYENRAIADADFRNDAVDAGEIGAGHQVTALYEIEPTGRAGDGPMATVRVRWKPMGATGGAAATEATEASFDVHAKSYQAFEGSPPGHRRALVVAQFAEILRRSIHARGESLDDLIQEATKLQAQIPNDAEYAEFVTLLLRAKDAILRTMPACDELCQTIDAVRSNAYLGAVFTETGRDAQTMQEIEANRAKLEQRLRELLRQQAESSLKPLDSLGYAGSDK